MNKKIITAIIDVGTLKSKFEIRSFDKFLNSEILYKDKKLTVLGRDLPKTNHMIIERSIKTTAEALKDFKKKMNEFNVDVYKAVTTEAIRKAKNSNIVLKRLLKETGINLEVLSPAEEAKLFFTSVSTDFPDKVIAAADIGGGSVQVIIGENDSIYEVYLFKTGTYFMQENLSKTHHPTGQEQENAKQYVQREMISLGSCPYQPKLLIYGTTNIIDFFQAMNLKLNSLQNSGNHPYYIDVSELAPLYKKITDLCYEDRMPLYPAEPYYIWSADNALINIFQIAYYLNINTIVPSNNNISTGLHVELIRRLIAKEFRRIFED